MAALKKKQNVINRHRCIRLINKLAKESVVDVFGIPPKIRIHNYICFHWHINSTEREYIITHMASGFHMPRSTYTPTSIIIWHVSFHYVDFFKRWKYVSDKNFFAYIWFYPNFAKQKYVDDIESLRVMCYWFKQVDELSIILFSI